ncbi:MAG: 50S ribosomal protein L24 [Candidatus Xiphinematobacter sp.]|nr:MAG: 50S ribosomal protein L24 [Candidatus Xiphinematobacter sp.]QQY08656.1 MAG: 50S ribosomal protein L24 [Candidatus Xiphinematobacter sp.]QQY09392.1 MAG: 50S ribosomal protein L24 [Candidatus Xiphinematobacter sp.]QQY10142.1 MAG: 50S ribosomal protein L24 [Candidatus Xiphinematobacter sp.]QQY10877.1 MAG: 50S ribosomal protein L24 [Candidatus Xiphinematobacter sp.]
MIRRSLSICRGDTVKIISGNYRGAQGRVLRVLRKRSRAIVEGVHLVKKHQRKSQEYPNGAIIEKEGPIHISNLQLIEKGRGERGN